MLSFRVRYNISRKFTKLPSVKRALQINAIEIFSNAKDTVNVDTARLQSSIHWRVLQNGQTIEIGSNVEYAAAQEKIKSYLESSLKAQEATLQKDIANAIKNDAK